MTTAEANNRKLRKTREGRVIGAKMDKTLIVQVERRVRHKLYGKEIKQIKKFYVHDEKNEARVGDVVQIMETRPLSKLKRWRLVKVTSKSVE